MTTNTTSTINNTRTATYFTYDHFGKKIVGSELNFKKSGNPNNPQYAALMAAMAAHPNYELSAVAPKVKKQTYAGLNNNMIAEYVDLFGNEAQKAELAEMTGNDETYPTIKSWFVENFKAGFSVEKAKREIAEHKLKARKAKVRATVRAKVVKATPAAVEAPAVINF